MLIKYPNRSLVINGLLSDVGVCDIVTIEVQHNSPGEIDITFPIVNISHFQVEAKTNSRNPPHL